MKTLATSEISIHGVFKNDQSIHQGSVGDFKSLATGLYRALELQYAKFFKMDGVCKLAFLATEVLLSDIDPAELEGLDVGVILTTRTGCLESDKKHLTSYIDSNNFFPSPAVFVYTLPNIMLGEICIKFKIKGESTCLVSETLDKKLMNTYVSDLINREKYRYCIAGIVDFSEDNYSAKLSLFGA